MEKSVFEIGAPADNQEGKFALLITRSMGMMGPSNVLFFVDNTIGLTYGGDNVAVFEGYVIVNGTKRTVVTFPAGCLFMMIPRDQLRSYTPLEAATREREQEKVMEATFGNPKPEPALQTSAGGGQYL